MAQPNCGISLSFSFLNFALLINLLLSVVYHVAVYVYVTLGTCLQISLCFMAFLSRRQTLFPPCFTLFPAFVRTEYIFPKTTLLTILEAH